VDAGIARGFAGNLGEELRQARPRRETLVTRKLLQPLEIQEEWLQLGDELVAAKENPAAKLIPHLNAAACLREVAVGLLRANVATVQLPEDSVHRQESRAASGPAVAPRLDHGRPFAERTIWAGMVFRTTQRAGPLARSDTDHAAPPATHPLGLT